MHMPESLSGHNDIPPDGNTTRQPESPWSLEEPRTTRLTVASVASSDAEENLQVYFSEVSGSRCTDGAEDASSSTEGAAQYLRRSRQGRQSEPAAPISGLLELEVCTGKVQAACGFESTWKSKCLSVPRTEVCDSHLTGLHFKSQARPFFECLYFQASLL